MNDNSVRRSGFRNSRRTHNGHTKGKCLRWKYMREPERLKRVTFVSLQQRNASRIASRSTVAADKSLLRVLTPDQMSGRSVLPPLERNILRTPKEQLLKNLDHVHRHAKRRMEGASLREGLFATVKRTTNLNPFRIRSQPVRLFRHVDVRPCTRRMAVQWYVGLAVPFAERARASGNNADSSWAWQGPEPSDV